MGRTLKDWETFLSKQMPGIRLLSELGLNYQDMLQLAEQIKAENKRHKNLHQTTSALVANFPCAFVSFLAAFAAQNTDRFFWDAVAPLIDVTGAKLKNANWHNHFIQILKARKIPVFESLSFVYVANMRIHGGIPAYSLRDFFSNMLMPALENPEYIELQGKELLDALLARSSVQLSTDSIVRNFFENTAEIGVKYLEDCRSLAREYRSSRQISGSHTLPHYVVEKLINFLEYREDSNLGLRRPRIRFDPEGEGLLLELVEQPISGVDVHGAQARWQVLQNQKTLKEIRARILRRGSEIHAEKQEIPLGFLTEPFQVTFSRSDSAGGFEKIREWTFEIRSPNTPNLLVFRAEDNILLRWSQSLPARDLLLVVPLGVSLQFEGEARLIHTPNMAAAGWQDWRAEYRALAGAFSVALLQDGEIRSEISIQKQLEQPRLDGNLFTPNLDDKPLFLGSAPQLHMPLRPGIDPQDELKRWRVELRSAGEAEPVLHQEIKPTDLQKFVAFEPAAFTLDLACLLVGSAPKGTYHLRVRGPLETDLELPFRVWQSLAITDLPEYILPAGEEPTTLHVLLPAGAGLEAQSAEPGLNITGGAGQYTVKMDESIARLDLNLTWSLEEGAIHVPVSIPLPRIKWRLVLGEETRLEWGNRSLRKPTDAFLQFAQTPALLVHLPGIENQKNLTLRMIDPENPGKALQEFTAQSSVKGSEYARFELAAKDTIQQNRDITVFEFQLLLVDKQALFEPVSLLCLTREIDVSDIRIEETGESLFLLWHEPNPLKNRRVFIRSLWKVSADSLNIKIPDQARGKFDLLEAGYSLPPSCYEVHFYVAASWEPDLQSAPGHSTFKVMTISPEGQLAWLDRNLQKNPDSAFVNHFERACIYDSMGEGVMRDEEINGFCYHHLDQAKLKDLFHFHEWIKNIQPQTGSAVRMKMYNPERLQSFYANSNLGESFRQRYLAYVPQTNLKQESANLLIRHENDPIITFYALRELLKRNPADLLETLAGMLESWRLSEADAIRLLDQENEHFIKALNAAQPNKINLRLLSGLLQNQPGGAKDVSSEKLILLCMAEADLQVAKKYLHVLIERGEKSGLNLVLQLFQNSQLRGDEVTDIFGSNPGFSTRVLSAMPQTHTASIQISELKHKYPLETGTVLAGMFIKLPAGWGRIDEINDIYDSKIEHTAQDDRQAKFLVTLHPGQPHEFKATVNMQENKLILPSPGDFYRCGKCGFIANKQNIILGKHTKEAHNGMGGSIVPIYNNVQINERLVFSQSIPEN